jgi:polysaccharide export outer membrane protein
MGHEGDNDDNPAHETLSFSEFVSRTSAQLGAGRAVLTVAESGGGERVFPINRNPTIIGRSNNADVVLLDPTVSDFHARIIKHSFGYTVEDMGSAEGTFLRDKRVNHARLIHGDTLRLGNTILTFADESAAAAKNPAQSTALVPERSTVQGVPARSPARRITPVPRQEFRYVEVPPAASVERPRRLADSEEAAPSLDDVILKVIRAARYLRRRMWLILGLTAVGVTLGAASFDYFPPVRAAYCVVTLHPAPRTNPIEPEMRPSPADPTQFFAGAERSFLSRESILGALRKMGAREPDEPWADAIAKRMRFESIGNNTYTAVMTPPLLSGRSDWHLRFLDVHLRNYIDTEIEKKLKVFVAEVDFMRTQTEAADRRLQDIARESVQFREANSDQILAQSTLGPGSQTELESKRIEVAGRVDRLAGELEGVRSQLHRGSALSQAKSQSAQADRDALSTVNRKLTELRAQGLADGHPDVQRLLNEQKNLQRIIDEHLHSDVTQFEKSANVAYDSLRGQADQLQAQLRAARAERGTIEAGLRSLRTVSSHSPKVNARIEELTRMKEDAERQHSLLFDRLKKAEVHLQLERVSTTSRYEIVVPARLESPPGRKAFALRLALGLLVGLGLATATIGLAELRKLFTRVAHKAAVTGLFVIVAASLLACAHDERFTWAADLPLADAAGEPTVRPRDTILVEVDRQPTLSGEFVVREDGHYAQPMVGSIRVGGQTARQIADAVAAALKDVVVAPVVHVWITKTPPIRVSVAGEVKTAGPQEMTRDRTLLAALAQAGWLTEFAHNDRVFVVRAGSNERIRFRVRDITESEPHAARFRLADGDVVVVE